MAMAVRTLVSRLLAVSPHSLFSRSFATRALPLPGASPLLRLRPLLAAADFSLRHARPDFGFRCFSTRPTTSSLNDPSPNWSNRPPKETILLDGCDFEHWLVVMEPPDPSLTRDEIIDSYIKTLAQVVGSEDEARMSLYSVSTKHYFAFGCKVSEELSYKIKALPKVRWVLPDSYLDVKNKDYGGEPFIDGKAVPYDPKYHEEWVRNNARAMERSRRNDRPRNFDRSRNFERRRENMQNFQNREAPPMQNQQFQNSNAPNPTPSNAQTMQNQQFTTSNAPNPTPNAQTPLPPREGPPGYQNQVPNPQSSYIPNVGTNYSGSSPGYQGGPPGHQGGPPGHQGGGQAYQAGNPGINVPGGYQGGGLGGQAYQANNPGTSVPGGPNYQGGGQTYQAGNPGNYVPGGPGYPGGGPGYQGGNPTGYQRANPTGYQGGPSSHQGGGPSYQSGGPGGYQGGNPPYQGGFSNYQSPNSSYQGTGQNYQQGGGNYQGRDMPGRDQ